MNVDLAKSAIGEFLTEHQSVIFCPGLSQPKSSPLDPCQFQFTLSQRIATKPNLFLNFTETAAEFSADVCRRKIEDAVLAFLVCTEDIRWDITC